MHTYNSSLPSEHNTHPTYRPDIDGLRAVAIFSVVVFHAFPTKLQGGFIGVDIFFVISGFLISSIIFRSLQRGDFSFPEFYSHRVKRIFPALIVVLVASFIFGWFALLPEEFKQLGKHVAAGAGFVQNFVLLKEAGYFDTASELKPLMHLWSLAIEEQFYLLYPVFIWGVWRLGLNVLTIVLVLGMLSLGLSVSEVAKDAVRAFFVPQTRLWELLVGSALAYLQLFKRAPFSDWLTRWVFHPIVFRHPPQLVRHKAILNNLLSVLGLLLIMAAVFGIHKGRLFPGWWALAPVAGAFLLIMAGPDSWVNRKILANRLMVFVGLISYPLYLWHWPILSFARIVESEIPSREIRIGAVALSFLLAWLTYRLLEKPIRFGRRTWIKTAALTFVLILVAMAGYGTFKTNGLEFRESVKMYRAKMQDLTFDISSLGYTKCAENSANNLPVLTYCLLARNSTPVNAIFGDSHADHLFHGLAKKDSDNWLLIGNSSCPPVTGIHVISDVKNCNYLIDKALDFLVNSSTIQTVVLSFFGNYALDSSYAADHVANKLGPASIKITSAEFKSDSKPELFYLGLDRAVSKLEQANKSVVIVIDVPELPFFPSACIGRPFSTKTNRCLIPRSEVVERQSMLRSIIDRLQKAHPSVRVYDPVGAMCDKEFCYVQKNNSLIYRDSHHLSLRGSNYYAESFLAWFKER